MLWNRNMASLCLRTYVVIERWLITRVSRWYLTIVLVIHGQWILWHRSYTYLSWLDSVLLLWVKAAPTAMLKTRHRWCRQSGWLIVTSVISVLFRCCRWPYRSEEPFRALASRPMIAAMRRNTHVLVNHWELTDLIASRWGASSIIEPLRPIWWLMLLDPLLLRCLLQGGSGR